LGELAEHLHREGRGRGNERKGHACGQREQGRTSEVGVTRRLSEQDRQTDRKESTSVIESLW
jgi:hypothetical protein